MFKKGSVVYRGFQLEDLPASASSQSTTELEQHENNSQDKELSRTQHDKLRKLRRKAEVVVEHVDIIKDEFWQRRPWILSNTSGRLPG
jgi:tRNA(His) guanylyltransferase